MRRTQTTLLVLGLAVGGVLIGSSLLPGASTPVAQAAEDTKARKAAEKLLKSKDPAERERGVAGLEAVGWNRNVAKGLANALEDDDWAVQIRAIEAVGRIGTEDAKKDVEKLAVDGLIHWVRDAATHALAGDHARVATEHLIERARHEKDEEMEARALRAAGQLAEADQIGAFGVFLKGKELRSIEAAVEAVGRIAERHGLADEAYSMLRPVLSRRDEQRDFRAYRAAVLGIGRQGTPRARKTLLDEVFQQRNLDDYLPERAGRLLAAQDAAGVAASFQEALGSARDSDDRRMLARMIARAGHVEAAASAAELAKDSDARVRSEAIRALRMIDAKDQADVVKAALDDQEWIPRVEAVTALSYLLEPKDFVALGPKIKEDEASNVRVEYVAGLARLRDPIGIPSLKPYAEDGSWRVASAALATIGTLGIAEDLPYLLPYFEHKDWRVRAAAFEAAGRLRALDAIPHLIEALSDRDPVVEGVALANLQILSRETKIGSDVRKWKKWWVNEGKAVDIVKKSRQTDAQKRLDELRRERNKSYGTKEAVEILQKSRILVQVDSWDHVEIVLSHLEIPHTALRAQQLKDSGMNPNQVLLVNCAGNMDRDAMERVRWFVNVGGYVMTTDWALTKTVMPCFPGYMEQYSRSSTGNDVVVVENAALGHELTDGIFGEVPALQWWLEIQAFPITIVYPERCNVIVDSSEMKERYGSSPMATEFRWGLGRVQHSLSHFYLQEEGMQQASKPLQRKIFAADHLGLSLDQIRTLEERGVFTGGLDAETMKQIAPDYSMFRIIVNLIAEKSDWVENL